MVADQDGGAVRLQFAIEVDVEGIHRLRVVHPRPGSRRRISVRARRPSRWPTLLVFMKTQTSSSPLDRIQTWRVLERPGVPVQAVEEIAIDVLRVLQEGVASLVADGVQREEVLLSKT